MAMLINLGKLNTMAMLHRSDDAMHRYFSSRHRSQRADDLVAQIFDADGWEVKHAPQHREVDLVVSKGHDVFAVEIKSLAEGRSDRVIPMLSQAILQAQVYARMEGGARPLAIICVESASPSLLNQVISFSEKYAPNVAVGIIEERGLRHFRGSGLERLNVNLSNIRWSPSSSSNQSINLFSDLNQWMLKLLLAPEIPESLLAAPRRQYRNASELAVAAEASKMSASRFVQQLRKEGFIEDISRGLHLVRRVELFRRWRAATFRQPLELPMRFLIRGSAKLKIREIVSNHQACLGLFAAANEFQFGHVTGVPPYIYVPKLPRSDDDSWKELVRASPSEVPDLILRQATSPSSVFRGVVHRDGMGISDIIQVWLDVSDHPSRGQEQADVIYRKVLRKIIEGGI